MEKNIPCCMRNSFTCYKNNFKQFEIILILRNKLHKAQKFFHFGNFCALCNCLKNHTFLLNNNGSCTSVEVSATVIQLVGEGGEEGGRRRGGVRARGDRDHM